MTEEWAKYLEEELFEIRAMVNGDHAPAVERLCNVLISLIRITDKV